MTDVHDSLVMIEQSTSFKTFRKENPDAYLAHFFANTKTKVLEAGFYHPGSDLITVFSINPVERRPPEQVFKEHGSVPELDIASVTVGLQDVLSLAKDHCLEHYPNHPVTQEICILQQREFPVWNLTLVTQTLRLCRMQINARNADVLASELRSIMDLQQK